MKQEELLPGWGRLGFQCQHNLIQAQNPIFESSRWQAVAHTI